MNINMFGRGVTRHLNEHGVEACNRDEPKFGIGILFRYGMCNHNYNNIMLMLQELTMT